MVNNDSPAPEAATRTAILDPDALTVEFHDALIAGRSTSEFSRAAAQAGGAAEQEWRRIERVLLGLTAARDLFHTTESRLPQSRDAESGVAATPLERLGRFKILGELGRGGLGVVFLAHDPVLDRQVALKVPRPEALLTPAIANRFDREAQALAILSHPNIVPIYEVGTAGAIVYIATAYCRGPNLADWLREQSEPVSERWAALLVVQLADAMAYAHSQGVLHRDLKPTNVLLESNERRPEGEPAEWTPRIVDFGLARIEGLPGGETRTGVALGTPAYMAPEQAVGNVRQIGPATDVYGLGALLYELLTRRAPFGDASEMATLRQVIDEEPTPPDRFRADLSPDFQAICLKCLEKAPERRYASADALAGDLRRFLAGAPTVARPLRPAQRLARWARRRPAWFALWCVSLLGTLVLVTTTIFFVVHLGRAERTAQANAELARDQEEVANKYLYTSRMRLAFEHIDHGEVAQAEEVLQPYASGTRLEHLRGFEWQFLQRQLHAERLNLAGHRGEVYDVAFSPDGSRLASGGEDGTVRFWDPRTGQSIHVLDAHRSCVNDISFSPDGQLFATVSCDRTVKLWDAKTYELRETLAELARDVHCVAFSPSGRLLAAGSHDTWLRIWDVETSEVISSFTSGAAFESVVWGHDDTLFASAGGGPDGTKSYGLTTQVFRYHVPTGDLRMVRKWARGLAVSPDGQDLLAASGGARYRSGEISSVAEFSARSVTFPSQANPLACVAVASNGKYGSGSEDGSIRIWDSQTGECQAVFLGHKLRVQSLAFAPNYKQLASASFDGTVKLWSLIGDSLPVVETTASLNAFVSPQFVITTSKDLRFLAIPDRSDHVQVFETSTGEIVGSLTAPNGISALRFDTDNPAVLHGFSCGRNAIDHNPIDNQALGECRNFVWRGNWRDAVCETKPYPNDWVPTDAVILSNGRYLCGYDRHHKRFGLHDIWLNQSWLEQSAAAYTFSPDPDDRNLAIHFPERSEVPEANLLFDLKLRSYRSIASGPATAISLHANLAANGGIVRDLVSGRELLRSPYHLDVECGDFSPNGRNLATGDHAGMVRLCNVETGQVVAQFPVVAGPIIVVRFSPDGQKLAAIALEGYRRGGPGEYPCRLYLWSGEPSN